MFGFIKKCAGFILRNCVIIFVEYNYGKVKDSITIGDSKVTIHYVPSDDETLLFTTGLSSFKQRDEEGYRKPFSIELFAHLPKGLSFEQILESNEFSFIKEIVNKVYTSLVKGNDVFPDTVLESEGNYLPQFDSVVLSGDYFDPLNLSLPLRDVVFLALAPLYHEENEYFATHEVVDVGETIYRKGVAPFFYSSRKPMKLKSESLERQALDIFGESLAVDARNAAINTLEIVQTNDKAAGDVELKKELKALNPEQLTFINESFPKIINTTLDYFLQMLNQDEDIEVIINVDDGSRINIKDICPDFSEEMFSENGWIERFGKNPSRFEREPLDSEPRTFSKTEVEE